MTISLLRDPPREWGSRVVTKGISKTSIVGLVLHKLSIELLQLPLIVIKSTNLCPIEFLLEWSLLLKTPREIKGTFTYINFLLVVDLILDLIVMKEFVR